MAFVKAERKQSKLRLGLSGPSGSGKTYSALLMARGLGKKVAVVDTEKGSASLYSHLFNFDVSNLSPPFLPENYIREIADAEKNGYDVLIIDSISHAWMGEGGVREQKDTLDQNPRSNQWTNWKKPKEAFSRLKNKIIFSSIHIICGLRAKQAYEQTVDETGRKKIEKMGLEPQIEPGFEYELTTIFDMQMNHHAMTTKDRTGLFDNKIFIPTEETGRQFLEWLNSGKPSRNELFRQLKSLAQEKNMTEQMGAYLKTKFRVESSKDLTDEQLMTCLLDLQAKPEPESDGSHSEFEAALALAETADPIGVK